MFGGDDPLMSALLEYYTVMQDDVLNTDKFQETIDKVGDVLCRCGVCRAGQLCFDFTDEVGCFCRHTTWDTLRSDR